MSLTQLLRIQTASAFQKNTHEAAETGCDVCAGADGDGGNKTK